MAIAIDGKNANAFHNRGSAYEKVKGDRLSKRMCQFLLNNSIVFSFEKLRQLDNAIGDFTEAINIDPKVGWSPPALLQRNPSVFSL